MRSVLLVVVALCLPLALASADMTFFGEDLNALSLGSWPNAGAAASSFVSHLNVYGVESFETTIGETYSVPATFSPVTTGTVLAQDLVILSGPTYTNQFPIDGQGFVQSSYSVYVSLNSPVNAFGFYTTDAGDVDDAMSVELFSGGNLVNHFSVGNNLVVRSADGSALFWGVTSDSFFDGVGIDNSNPLLDVVGYDHMIAGDTRVPEPCTCALLGMGLVGLAGWRRRRK